MKVFFLLLFFPLICICQKPKPDSVFCDCERARVVSLRGNSTINPTLPPSGPGNKSEIGGNKQHSPYTFEKEHFSSWYKLIVLADGNLTFDIIPNRPTDDYDFMVFEGKGKMFCDSFLLNRAKPLRACISRNKSELKGMTGLKIKSDKELIKEGPGEAYVKAMKVKKGEVYYLVLDNVYENGGGHSIKFFYEELVTLSGKVTNEHAVAIRADVTVTNNTGDTIEKTKTDDEGYYKMEVALRKNLNYSLTFFNDESFFNTKEISTNTPKDTLVNIRTILPGLKKGGKYNIKNINFIGGSPNYLPSAVPSINSLYKIMKKNPGLKILIVGHTNGCSGATNSQVLSVERAKTIQGFLTGHKIDGNRILIEGKGCSQMLYSEKGPEWQQSMNRRVEIKVLEFN